MNFVTLNGVKSTTIKGLLIQSLPPITKPLIRTQIEEIDGRDGDIVTKLGFSAYNKEITIGLHGDFDVNEVISFFNSSGKVTFSNEPDKYYYYEIIDQIDFERLIRFRTATVVFHVQPFKYSSETPLTEKNQLLSFRSFTDSKNGIIINAQNGVISVKGTATIASEFYMPINALKLKAGDYTWDASTQGTGATACSLRLIGSVPSDSDSFGGTYLALLDNNTSSLDDSLDAEKTFNYLWFYVTAGTAMDFTIETSVKDDNLDSIVVNNLGNTKSKPKITVYGSGTINLSLNGNQIFAIELGADGYITIDSAQMEATKDGVLKNRSVTGNYDNFVLNVGKNIISWTGNVTEIDVENYSRWI